ncbi:MAG TPA: hypothetical protein VN380_04350 [Thermoanaerobaculia bacterium]|nr:hypothetical protein [Thermoanaerobaculia bacterium]
MIPELCALALALAVGIPLARMLNSLRASASPRDNVSLLTGEGLLLGIGICAALLAVLPWSRLFIVPALLVIAVVAVWRSAGGSTAGAAAARWRWALPLYALAIIALIGYALYATVAPPPEFDYLTNWGFKAKAFFAVRSIDWQFLGRTIDRNVHPDYPLLLPLTYDFIAVLRDGWSDAHLGVVHVAFAAALLLVIHGAALEETRSRLAAAFITAALVPFAATPWIGLAEGPFVAFGTAALLLIRRANMALGAILLGLAASTKNEGLTLIVAAALGLICARRMRDVIRLWPAVAIPLPWLIARSLHSLPTDIATGGVMARVADHLRNPMPFIAAIASVSLGKPLLWIALAIGIVIASRTLATRERFLIITLAVQFACYIGAYLATPFDLAWHVTWSWERLVAHLTPALTYVVLASLIARQPND